MRVRLGRGTLHFFIRVALVVTALPLCAQEVPEGPVFTEIIPAWATEVAVTLPKFTVPLKDCPAGISVVDPNVLEDMPRSASADEALALVPGIQIDNPLNQASVHLSVRGQGAWATPGIGGVQVLLDGIPLSGPFGYEPGLFAIDWSSVQRVEALRGPVSALYGAGGASGALHIVTREGPAPVPEARFDSGLGTDRFWKVYTETGGGNRRGFTYRASASRTFGGGYRDHSTFSATNLTSNFRWNLDAHGSYISGLLAAVDYLGKDAGGLTEDEVRLDRTQASADAVAYDAFARARTSVAGTAGKLIYSDRHDVTYSLFERWGRTRDSLPGTVTRSTWTSPGTTVQYNWHYGRPGGFRNHLSVGFDTSWQDADTSVRENLGGAAEGPSKLADATLRLRDYGITVSGRIEMGAPWTLMFSARRDDLRCELKDRIAAGGINLSGTTRTRQESGRIGLTFNPTDLFNLYASWGQGFLPPSAAATLQAARAAGRYRALPTATSRGAEMGVRGAVGQFLYYDAAIFWGDSRDDLLPLDPADPASPPAEDLFEATSSRRYGLEAYISWFPIQGLALRGTYTYTHATFRDCILPPEGEAESAPTDCSGLWLPGVPQHRGRLDAQYTWAGGWAVGLALDLRTRSYADAANTMPIGGYTLFHPRASYSWRTLRKRGEVFVQVRNASDRRVIAWAQPGLGPASLFPAPRREFFVGVRLLWDDL